MGNINYVVLYLFSLLSTFLIYQGYSFLSTSKFKFNVKNITILLVFSLLFLLNNNYNFIISKGVISILLLLISIKIIFNDNVRKSVICTLIFYLILAIFDFIFSFVFYWTNEITITDISQECLIVGSFSLVLTFMATMVCKMKSVKEICKKIIEISKSSYINITIIFLTIFFIIILSTKLSLEYNFQKYFLDTLLLLIFLFFFVFALVKNYLAQKEKREKEVLLDFISKYEKIIDENRENKHEMLNNLIILRSFDHRNDSEYDKVINELIVRYGKNSGETVKNISKLPKGLKGILYYKMNDMKQKHINLTVSISQRVSSPLEKLETEEYVILSKIVGIIMDNALEAALKSKDKSVFIEVYEQNGIVIMVIENSCDSIVNVNDIKKKNFSTKGTGRGLGLHIAELLLKKSKHITMSQHSTDVFITKITIE